MAYEIHLKRVNDGEPITLSEWKAAVEKLENVRLSTEDLVMTNPSTGDVIRLPNAEGDAEIFFPEESKWRRVYRWREGRITFKGSPGFDNPNDTLRQTTRLLATILDAKITGDGGEFYD
ncbi:MAG TPA: hypothetical protein VF721_02560 [Pyrinomonadaceae bacterium]|jgi:hypothetical protein